MSVARRSGVRTHGRTRSPCRSPTTWWSVSARRRGARPRPTHPPRERDARPDPEVGEQARARDSSLDGAFSAFDFFPLADGAQHEHGDDAHATGCHDRTDERADAQWQTAITVALDAHQRK